MEYAKSHPAALAALAASCAFSLTSVTPKPKEPHVIAAPEAAYQDALDWLGAEREGFQEDGSVVRCERGLTKERIRAGGLDLLQQAVAKDLWRSGAFKCGRECEAAVTKLRGSEMLREFEGQSNASICRTLEGRCRETYEAIGTTMKENINSIDICNILCGTTTMWTSGLRSEHRRIFPDGGHLEEPGGPFTICARGGPNEKFGYGTIQWNSVRFHKRTK